MSADMCLESPTVSNFPRLSDLEPRLIAKGEHPRKRAELIPLSQSSPPNDTKVTRSKRWLIQFVDSTLALQTLKALAKRPDTK